MTKKFDPGVYRDILRVREAYGFDLGGFLIRFYQYMMNIGTITMLTLSGYSFFLAGLVSSAIALSTFVVAPRVSKLVDEQGQHRVVPVAGAITMAGFCLLMATVILQGPDWLLFIGAFFMGFLPNPQAMTRARWTYLIRSGRLGSRAPSLRTMFSYEGVLDDIGFMFSPAISIALASSLFPTAGLLAGGVSFVIGVIILSVTRSTEPPPSRSREKVQAQRTKSVFRTSSMVRLLFCLMLLLGAFFGIFDATTVALAEELGDPNIASVVLMISSFVSMIMGFVFGMLRLRVPQYVQLAVAGVLVGCAYGCMAFIDSAPTLYVVSITAALFYAPFLIICNASAERVVPDTRLTEALTWLSAGSTCGLAIGPTAGGLIIDTWGAAASFDMGAAVALIIPLLILVFYRSMKKGIPEQGYEEVAFVEGTKK